MKQRVPRCQSILQSRRLSSMSGTVFQLAAASVFFFGSASYAGEWCHDVTEGFPKTTTGPVRLYVSNNKYAFGYDAISNVVNSGGGINCSHTKPAAKTELLSCSNGLRAVGVSNSRQCTAEERYNSRSSNHLICKLFGEVSETSWVVTDKSGQTFNNYTKDWESERPSRGCVLTSPGRYELRGYKVLRLMAGDFGLYFVRDQLETYNGKRQPAL